jgi:hypothetical protein
MNIKLENGLKINNYLEYNILPPESYTDIWRVNYKSYTLNWKHSMNKLFLILFVILISTLNFGQSIDG